MPPRTRYNPPPSRAEATLREILATSGRPALDDRQLDLLRSTKPEGGRGDARIYYAGNLDLVRTRCVSIVGTRDVSAAGKSRAARLARELASAGVTVVSGLAKGVDTAAMESAIAAGGHVIGVIGTAIDKAYPAENARLQETVWENHLLLTPFGEGERVFRSNFPKRNRVMAAISDATVIVEASDTSGTLHQAAECQRLGRWLFILRSVAEDRSLDWPRTFLKGPKTRVLDSSADVIEAIR